MEFKLGDITVDVVLKDIKNLHLSVYPPDGKVRISAPTHMSIEIIRIYAISKLGWIKKQQRKLQEQERETPREYLNRESHYVWGKRYLLKLVEADSAPAITLKHSTLLLQIRPNTDDDKKQELLASYYREQVRETAQVYIAKWEPVLSVSVHNVYIQHMKTRWGSCNPLARNIRLNTELAKKPKECLEYIVVHEMAHLIEPSHNPRFTVILDNNMPKWRYYRDTLNRLPVRHESWRY